MDERHFEAKLALCEAPQVCGVAVMPDMCALGDMVHGFGGWGALLWPYSHVMCHIHLFLLQPWQANT